METAATTSAPTLAFHSDDLDEVPGYRTMSSLAIVSLLFGLASPLCFVTTLLMALPLFGTAISIIALRRIAASDGALAGRWAAATGLALCVASAAAALTHVQLTRYLRTQQAESVAREWIQLLVTGKMDQAFELTLEGARPAPPPDPGEPTPPETPREHFEHDALVQALTSAGPESEIRFDGTQSYDAMTSGQFLIEQRFTITPASRSDSNDKPKGVPIEAILTLARSRIPGKTAQQWLVQRYQAPGLNAEAGLH